MGGKKHNERATMNYLTADQELMERLAGLRGPVEIRDPEGKVLGQFTPATDAEASERAEKYFDLAEAERTLAEKSQGSSLTEVWERIRALERQG
jgi:hypothetical protein